MASFGYVMLGELATTRPFYGLHRAIDRLSGRRVFSRSAGCPVVLVTTTGRKSGEARTAPIFGFREGKSIVAVPSNAGKKHYPSWYFNLRASPLAQVQLRERLWPFLTSQYRGYDVYRARTERHIPVVFLDPV